MYRFAYLYVKLGYILAGIVLGVSVVFCGSALIVLELQKPRESADRFNFDFERIHAAIRAQSQNVQQTFDLDPKLPALTRLNERTWRAGLVTLSASKRLDQEREEALRDCDELRNAVLAKLEEDIGLILAKLSPADGADTTKATGAAIVADPRTAPETPGQNAMFIEGVDFRERINDCEAARWTVAKILEETRNLDNRSALERAQGEIERFRRILSKDEAKVSRPIEFLDSLSPKLPTSPAQSQSLKPSRKDNVRLELMDVLSLVRNAVTTGWSLEAIIASELGSKLEDFRLQAKENEDAAGGALRLQGFVVGFFLVLLLIALFIAVGSDLVKAILDSAVWLSHIYSNTSSPHSTDVDDEDPEAR